MFNSFRKSAIALGITFMIVMILAFVTLNLFSERKDIYYDLAVLLIIGWIIVLIFYYGWAIYFYNINMGWTKNDWDKNDKAKETNPELVAEEPVKNPNHEETLGLPPGTVRGTIALSLLIGGLAMMIASLSMTSNLEQNQYFIDNFEFFKTAYLMMIAFYFGNKSLEFLKDRKLIHGVSKDETGKADSNGLSSGQDNASTTTTSATPGTATTAKNLMTTTPPAGVDMNETDGNDGASSSSDFDLPNSKG